MKTKKIEIDVIDVDGMTEEEMIDEVYKTTGKMVTIQNGGSNSKEDFMEMAKAFLNMVELFDVM